jgi:MerR family transcriptional regulator, thiopeptide resistance regulator
MLNDVHGETMSTFRIQEFAKLAGVTVRALRHYDRLNLLSPRHRSERGHRLYCHDDLGRIERILVLRHLGLSLREIAALLNAPRGVGVESLAITLARQHSVLSARREGLDRIVRAIEHAQQRAQSAPEDPEWRTYKIILEEIQMQTATDWTEKYFSPKAIEALRERRAALTSEQRTKIHTQWQTLYADIQSAMDREVPPDSAEARALVARWMRLGDEFTLGNSEIGEGFRRMYDDEGHWPEDEKAANLRANMSKPEHRSFFRQAVHACLRHGS